MSQQHLKAAFYHSGTSKAPLTAAMCLAAACKIEGTAVNEAASPEGLAREEFRTGHPSGMRQLTASCRNDGGKWQVQQAGVFGTARRLFDGHVRVPGM